MTKRHRSGRAPAAPAVASALAALLLLSALGACAAGPSTSTPTPVAAARPPLAPAGPALGVGFARRGIIEGFYGPPWSHQDRLDMLRFMGRVGLNVYFYGPKDDPYHRDRWREPYPAEQIAAIGELVKVGREGGVDIWFAISPGLSMSYSDDADYAALLAKLDAVAAVGVRHVGLFLDDVPETLTHPEDRTRFATPAAAHASLIRRLKADLDTRGLALAVVQTTYTDAFGSRSYLHDLGAALPTDIPLAWTGVDVYAPDVTAPQAREWGAILRRRPLLWDNYPVNDYARWRPFLGPLRGRAPDLATAVNGYLANPMNEAHASMLPLWTIADYLRDPVHYDPDRSVQKALVALYGRPGGDNRGVEAMAAFEAAYGNDLFRPGPIDPLYVPARAFDYGRASGVVLGMQRALGTMRDLAAADSATWAPLVRELTPFADSAAARLARFRADSMYAFRNDSLVFRSQLERVVVPRATSPVLNGDLGDWSDATWRPMYSDAGLGARIAFRADPTTLYIALQVPDTAVVAFGGDTVTSGDHVAMVLAADPSGAETRMSERDLLLIATPASDTQPAAIGGRSLRLTAFFRDAIAEHADFVFSDFQLANLSGPVPPAYAAAAAGARVASGRDAQGWRLEIAIPRAGLPVARVPAGDVLRMSVVASDGRPGPMRTASLGSRNNAGNPTTYTEIVLPR
jgi:hypothetical protein